MTEVVYKYSLNGVTTPLLLPQGAQVLFVGTQEGEVRLWVRQRTDDAEKVERTFAIVGTGHPEVLPTDVYVGTTQVGPYVWHVFERAAQ